MKYSNLKFKILLSFFIFYFLTAALTFLFIYKSEFKNILRYSISMFVIFIFFEYVIYFYINRIQKKSIMIGLMYQKYIERSQSKINEAFDIATYIGTTNSNSIV